MKMIVAILPLLFAVAIVINFSYNKAVAHNFYKNEASVFFTLIKQVEVENELVQSNFPKNTSLALEHAENADRLLKDIFYFDEDNSDDTDFRNTYDLMVKDLNSTTSALISANVADEILKQYGLALGFDSAVISNLANMSMSMTLPADFAKNRSDMMMSMGSPDPQNISNSQNVNTNITKQVNYQTATMLARSLKNLFLHDLKNATILNSTGLMRLPMEIKMASVNDLGEGINNLISTLNRKGPLDEVMSIVHGQIHPNVFLAFDLKLKGD